jgi:hypothetical protein
VATAADIISDAFLAAGIGDQYNALDANSAGVGLRTLNRLLSSWSNESLIVYNQTQDSFTMTPGQAAYSTTLLTSRPVEIAHVFTRLSNVDMPCELIGPEDYALIGYKTTPGIPAKCYYNAGFPNGTLTFFPVPSGAYECFVGYRAQLDSIASLQTPISLPPGYETALVYGLATMLCPMFGTDPTPTCIFHAKNAKEKIKPANESLNEVQLGVPLRRGLFNIFSGE